MPLIKSTKRFARLKNIAELVKSGKPAKQAVAIAYNVQRDAKQKDGK